MGEDKYHEEFWRDAVTLGEVVFKLVEEKKTNTPEFELLMRGFGKKKLRELYLEEKKKKGK